MNHLAPRFLLLLLLVGACARTPARVETVAPPERSWQPLFDGATLGRWQPTVFGGEGAVKVEQGRILLHRGDPLTGITLTGDPPARTGYELRLQAMRVEGGDFFCGLTFPVGPDEVSLIVGGWGGTVVGLSTLDEQDASENETSRNMTFTPGRWYAVRVRVDGAHIQAWIDDAKIVDVRTGVRKVGVRAEVNDSRPLGVASYRTTAALRALEWRPL